MARCRWPAAAGSCAGGVFPLQGGRPRTAARRCATVHHVALAARHILDASGVHQHHLEAPLFQHPEQRYPVHAGGLHGHGCYAAFGKPVRQAVQVRSEGLKLLHRLFRTILGNRHEMTGGAYIDARRMKVQLGQLRWIRAALLASIHRPSAIAV